MSLNQNYATYCYLETFLRQIVQFTLQLGYSTHVHTLSSLTTVTRTSSKLASPVMRQKDFSGAQDQL